VHKPPFLLRPVPFKVRLFLNRIEEYTKASSALITAVFTVVLAVATLALVYTSTVQHYDSIDAIGATNRLAKATEDSAAETASQTKLQIQSLEQTRTAFETGSRAWISPIAVGLRQPLENGKPISFGIWYDNVGKLPAIDLHTRYAAYSFDNDNMDNGLAMATVDKEDMCRDVQPLPDAEVVYPNSGGVKMLISLKPPDPTTGQTDPIYRSFMSGNHSFVIQICIAYRTLNRIHRSAFCYFYRPGLSEGNDFNRCDKGNKAD
jgi:hypothetical protein